MAYTTVDVYVDLNDFDDQELIDELENRGWFVGEEKGWEPDEQLTKDEIQLIADLFSNAEIGSKKYFIYEKLRKR
jgi:hypothetical protein